MWLYSTRQSAMTRQAANKRTGQQYWCFVLVVSCTFCCSHAEITRFHASAATDLQHLFNPQPGNFNHWVGADTATSLPNQGPKNSSLWIFSDTLVGSVNPTTQHRRMNCMPHNSLGLLPANPTPNDTMQHLIRGGCSPPEPYSNQSNGFFAPPNSSQFYWLETGGRDPEGRLHLFAGRYSQPCAVGCEQHGTDIITILEEETWTFTTRELPGWAPSYTWPTGMSIENDGGDKIYFLGSYRASPKVFPIAFLVKINRAEFGQKEWPSIRFWASERWTPLPDGGVTALSLTPLFEDAPPETSLEYSPLLGSWFCLTIPFASNQLQIRTANLVTGPWSEPRLLYSIPAPWSSWRELGVFSYSPKHHRELAKSGEMIITFMSNANITTVENTPGVYIPQAIRVTAAGL